MKREMLNRFYGKKLKQARTIRNLTISDLSKKINVTHQSISKYENDKMTPSLDVLKEISNVLNFEISFFYTSPAPESFYENTFIFRKKAGVAKKYKDQMIEKMALILSFEQNLESYVKLPKFNRDLVLKRKDETVYEPLSDEKIEQVSFDVRRSLQLGMGPIDNITRLCEKLGIIVVFSDLGKTTIDGCSTFYEDRPYIVLNKQGFSSVRMRFTLAHELGHILLHSGLDKKHINSTVNSKQIEKEANLFASFLLMPEESFVQDINGLGLDYLLMLKKHWKVSIQAMVFRAEYLGVFTEDYALYLRQQISRKKWRKSEPFDDEIIFEEPVLINQALEFIQNNMKVSLDEITFKTGLSEKEILTNFNYGINHIEKKDLKQSGLRRIK
ncbi:Zn-dependent peptidase ImmA, M78 family [Halolactibacillus halophilus]|uniref:Transcriptional regulator n=2 Tax=Halolactibacillus halophilus TaxID=306540 RepID=A0A1I5Q033_9BACI|nr:XRE family transcriptional regulator [Halolactibacillus halophilus]GEM01926.1 transcriptional regulator [Halolactibacillus halophilus]SFP39684.1 Zn-dependent peptidase ImmA, M78 family [Halolactibacillus halophilus]